MADYTYNFSWQNPILRETIYPFRKRKLIDFLLNYKEVDLWKEGKDTGKANTQVIEKLKEINNEIIKERERILADLNMGIEAKKVKDKWFATIRETENLKFKQKYYLDREIERLQARRARLEEEKNNLLKRVNWYSEGDTRIQMWKDRAKEKDIPIDEIKKELVEVQSLRSLYDELDTLPEPSEPNEISIQSVIRWQLLEYKEGLNGKTHDELLELILDRFEKEPVRFNKWLQYMVIHFSGMRYRSAHGSWANPKYLLELLTREYLEYKVKTMSDSKVSYSIQSVVEKLEEEKRNINNDNVREAIDKQISKLKIWARRHALVEYWFAREIGEIQNLPDDEKVFLIELEKLKNKMEEAGDEIPDWAWKEIKKYTSLRLQTQDEDWEDISPERYMYENWRWVELLNSWERKDITEWRKHHEITLDLIVTRAVCNEVAEHIQHLRGLIPGAGLTNKPKWYKHMQEKNNGFTRW